MQRLVLYLPVHGTRADRYEGHARRWSLGQGYHVVEVTDDPARVRQLLAAGLADAVAVVAHRHRLDLPGLPVVEIPHPQPGEAFAGAGLLGIAAWLADRWWEQEAAAAVASVVVAGAASAAVAVAGAGQLGGTDRAVPPDVSGVVPAERPVAPVPAPRPALSLAPAPGAPAAGPAPALRPVEPVVEPPSSAAPVEWSLPPAAPTPAVAETRTPDPTPAPAMSPTPAPSPELAWPAPDDQRCLVDLEVMGADLQVCAR